MASFGKSSLEKLAELDPRLQEVLNEAIKIVDFTIICGTRSKEDQEKAFNEGKSKLHYPESKHNSSPSMAVDVAPYPIDWSNAKGFCYLAGIIMGIAAAKGIKLRWGGDFNRDYIVGNDKFQDLPHLEIDG
jgi:hypothetical protein